MWKAFNDVLASSDWKPQQFQLRHDNKSKQIKGFNKILKFVGSVGEKWDSMIFYDPIPDAHHADWDRFLSISQYDMSIQYGARCDAADSFELFDVWAKLTNHAKPTYGYCHAIPIGFRPIYYGWGICSGEISPLGRYKHLDKQVGAWFRFMLKNNKDASKHIRDVYRYNLLSASHMQVKAFDGATLAEWVEASEGRGTMYPIGNENEWVLWEVPESDRRQVRDCIRHTPLYFLKKGERGWEDEPGPRP